MNSLEEKLDQFIGTENYYIFNLLFKNCVATDGTQFLATEAKAFWLLEAIASYQVHRKAQDNYFQVWEFDKEKGILSCEDGNNVKLFRQRIEYTSFPLNYIKLYAINNGKQIVIMLPNEY